MEYESFECDCNTAFCQYEPPVFLYPFTTEELYSEEYLRWLNNPQVTRTLGRFDYLMPISRKKLVEYYRGLNAENTIFLAIYYSDKCSEPNKQQQRFVGTLKIYEIEPLAQRASIGVMVGNKSDWNKNLATIAIRIACRYIFDVLGFRKITAGYISKNTGMEKAFLKNGFQVEATLKEHLFFEGEFVDHVFVCKFRKK